MIYCLLNILLKVNHYFYHIKVFYKLYYLSVAIQIPIFTDNKYSDCNFKCNNFCI